ncbi:MAG: PQQ-dependent sugar dehydrogenase [Phycisphaeraceae bacterium]
MKTCSVLFFAAVFACLWMPPTAQAQAVQQIWQNNCVRCHGDRGQGAMARSLLRPELTDAEHDPRFFEAIRDGLPDDGMDGYDEALSDEEMWGLVVHIRELQEQGRRRRESPRQPNDEGLVASTHHDYRFERVIEEGLTIPWALTFLPDGRMLIAERAGNLRLYDGEQLSDPVRDTPRVVHAGQGGLLGIALHPDYEQTGWVYLAYTHENDGLMTRVVRGRLDDQRWIDQEVIFEAPQELYLPTRQHFGCRLVFDDEGYLYFTIGDRGRGPHAQDLARPNGKVHRLHDDGRVPADNPFVDESDAMPSIWSYGHRNPQGLAFDHETGQLWATEHGPRGGDELNRIQRGGNYGWPEVSHGINYNGTPFETPWHDSDFIDPVLRWTPSIAACGLDVVRGDAFSQWDGDLLTGALAGQVVERLRVRDGEVVERERLIERMGRVRDVVCGPDGMVYIALNDPHHIVRLVPVDE